MNHTDHLNLLRKGIPAPGGAWADLGSGSGAFTLALAELIGSEGKIYSIDKEQGALRQQEQMMRAMFPVMIVQYIVANFTRQLDLPPLDGIVMANSLHYVRKKEPFLQQIRAYLRPGGRLLLVEYNADRGNPWVPYPLSYNTWAKLADQNGFTRTQLLATVPSRFLDEMYSAVSLANSS